MSTLRTKMEDMCCRQSLLCFLLLSLLINIC